MSEEQVSDTIEKLYDRLDDYDKQQLMSYGYLMEYTRTLEKEVKYQNDIVIKQKEVLDKIKKYTEENKLPEIYYDLESLKPILKHYIDADKILELLEEIE